MPRRKGDLGASTVKFRATVRRLLDDNSDNIRKWLEQVAADDPKAALDTVAKLAEFVAPKMARIEHTGKDGEKLTVQHMLNSLHEYNGRQLEDIEGEVLPANAGQIEDLTKL